MISIALSYDYLYMLDSKLYQKARIVASGFGVVVSRLLTSALSNV